MGPSRLRRNRNPPYNTFMKVPIYNIQGKEVGQTTLPKEIFEVPLKKDLVHQVAVAQMANKRQALAHTKIRSEVSGGGKKPWRQKGTGRARHGSIRSPLWVGGGVTFGPRKDQNFKQKINKKMRRKALFMALSEKARRDQLVVLEALSMEKPKTKEFKAILQALPLKEGSSLLVLPKKEESVFLSARNLPKVRTMVAAQINLLDVLSQKYLLMPEESIAMIQKTFLQNHGTH